MRFKKIALPLLSLVLAAGLTACGSSGGSNGGKTGADGKKVVEIMTWESVETNAMIDKVIKEKWKNDKITLKRIDAPSGDYSKKLGSLAQAKQLPAIFWCGNDTEQQYSQLGLLTDWTSKLGDKMKAEDFDGLEFWKSENGLGGLPSLRNVYGIFYNVDLFEKAGVPLPKPGWTWDDLFKAAEKLKGAGGSQFPLFAGHFVDEGSPYILSIYSVSAGGQPFVDDVNKPTKMQIDDKFVEGVNKMRDAMKKGLINPPEFDASNITSLFAAGQQPMMVGGQWLVQSLQNDAKKVKWGWAPYPVADKPVSVYDTIGMCSPNTVDQDATFEAVTFLQQEVLPQVMAETLVAPNAYKPGREGYLKGLETAKLDSVVETLKYGLEAEKLVGVRLTTPYASQVNELTTSIYLKVLKGEKPDEALQEYVTKVNQLREQNK